MSHDEPSCFLPEISLYVPKSCNANCLQGEESGWEKGGDIPGLSQYQRLERYLPHSDAKHLLKGTCGKSSLPFSSPFWSSKKRTRGSFNGNFRFLAHSIYSNVFAMNCFKGNVTMFLRKRKLTGGLCEPVRSFI